MGKIRVGADSAQEYKDAVSHAEALGLSTKEVWFKGAWETPDGEPVFLSGSGVPVEKVGRKYFHVRIEGRNGKEVVKVQPVSDNLRDKGSVKITFSG